MRIIRTMDLKRYHPKAKSKAKRLSDFTPVFDGRVIVFKAGDYYYSPAAVGMLIRNGLVSQ